MNLLDIIKELEQCGRLRTWGEESGAGHPSTARDSLDNMLRGENVLRGVAIETLTKVQRQVEIGESGLL